MNLKDAEKFVYIDPKEAQVDLGALVTHDEFMKPMADGDYRNRTIRRLIRDQAPWTSNVNLIYQLAPMFAPKCPYGGNHGRMVLHSGGGNMTSYHVTYQCPKCKSKIHLTLDADAVSFSPAGSEA